jgi:transportin-1
MHAIACLSHFIPISSPSLFAHVDAFLAALFKRASDDDPDVRRVVCQSLVLMLATKPDKLLPDLSNVAEYMLYSTQDSNESVALESCEFWLTFAEDPDLAEALRPLLPKVAPVLLNCMKYGEDDLMWLDGGEEVDDAGVEDREQDIKPKFYGSGKTHGFEHEAEGGANAEATPKKREGEDGGEDDGDADSFGSGSDDDDYDDEMSTEWNLRKCSAAALDVLAVRFGADLLNVLLPHLKGKNFHQAIFCGELMGDL